MHYSPLRYPGGKGKLTKFINSIFERNELIGSCYVEPYAGGASIALSLLFKGYASRIVINDYDRSIYAFWYSVLNRTDELCELITNTEVNTDEWLVQKGIQDQKETADLLILGFSTFFLNRTNRSGIIKAGVIGGKEQNGDYKIDARFNKENLIERIREIAKYRRYINLYNLDAIELMRQISNDLPENTIIYFDPPYYVKGKELYVNYYDHEAHLLVSRMIKGIRRHKWIVSYDNADEIRTLYKKNKKITYSLKYSAVNATKGTEVMIYHKNLVMPKASRPDAAK